MLLQGSFVVVDNEYAHTYFYNANHIDGLIHETLLLRFLSFMIGPRIEYVGVTRTNGNYIPLVLLDGSLTSLTSTGRVCFNILQFTLLTFPSKFQPVIELIME